VVKRAPILLVALLMTGCGDLSGDELGRRVDTLGAIAAEGRLIARDVERDRTKATFVRVQARDLAERADHEAEKVGDARPAPGTEAERRRTVALAEDLADALGELATHPGDERRGAQVGRKLVTVQNALDALGRAT
jgi:hypothetical protein